MAVLLQQRPTNRLVQGLNRLLALFGDMPEDGMHHLALVESFLAFYDILGGNTPLGKIDIS